MGIILLLVFGAVGFAVTHASRRASGKAWAAAAGHLRLEHTPGGLFTRPALDGSVRGVAVRVEVLKKGNRAGWTVYSALHPTPAPAVQFRRQHGGSFLRQFVGGRDVIIGDPRFDDSIVVDATDDAAITAYLTPARRAAILSVFSTWPNSEITDRWVSVSTHGRARNASEIAATVNRLADTCRLLADHEPLDAALESRDDGNLHDAAAAIRELNARSDPNVLTQMLEADALLATGESARAIEIVEDVARALPDDPEVEQWRALAAPPADIDAEPPDLGQQAVMDDLFSATRYGVQIDQRFAAAFADREVTWTGVVENSRSYRSDTDFGTDPGTKTMVDIGSVGSSRLMSNRVKAVIDLPDGTELEREQHITFTGTLLHVDRFTRRLYVRDAVLL